MKSKKKKKKLKQDYNQPPCAQTHKPETRLPPQLLPSVFVVVMIFVHVLVTCLGDVTVETVAQRLSGDRNS